MSEFFLSCFYASARLTPALIDVAWKSSALLATALVAYRLLGRGRVLARSALAHAALLGLLVLPALSATLPPWVVETPSAVAIPDGPRAAAETAPRAEFDLVLDYTASSEVTELAILQDGPRPAISAALDPVVVTPRLAWGVAIAGSCAFAYLAVTSLRFLGILGALNAARRLVESSEPFDSPALLALLERSRLSLGIGRPVGLRKSTRIGVPVVLGWRRPAIILPDRFTAEHEDSPAFISIFLHELAHVRRGDYGWNLALRVTMALYWPQPFAWLLARRVAAVREEACDDLCVAWAGGVEAYRDMLLAVARGLAEDQRPGPLLGLAIARRTALSRRIERLSRTVGSKQCLSGRPLRSSLLVAAVLAAGVVGAIELTPARPALASVEPVAEGPKPAGMFDALVVDQADGKPIPGALIRYFIDPGELRFTTGADGRVRLPRPPLPNYQISLDVWSDDHQRKRFSYDSGRPSPRIGPLPDSVKWELAKGEITVGGVVRDEQGKPVAGAVIEIQGMREKENALAFYGIEAKTDAAGRWSSRAMPANLSTLGGWVRHPDYEERYLSEDQEEVVVPAKAGTLVTKLFRGVRVQGHVLDEAGRPIAGARLTRPNRSHMGISTYPEAKTDARGRFVFPAGFHSGRGPGSPSNFKMLMASAPGRRPELRPYDYRPGSTETLDLEFRLPPGKVLKGRAVDQDGKPVPGAWVIIRDWKGWGWEGILMATDADGRFTFNGAPADPLKVVLSARNYQGDPLIVTPSDEEYVWKLKRTLAVNLTILDASDGKPIKRIEIERGRVDADGNVTWNAGEARPPVGVPTTHDVHLFGRASVSLETDAPAWRLRILAQGYRPFETPEIKSDAGVFALTTKLEPLTYGEGGGTSGTVVDAAGKPLPGVEVMMASQTRPATLHGDSWWHGQGTYSWSGEGTVVTDERGRFTFLPIHERYRLAAVGKDGYGEIADQDFAKEPALRLQPWGRIEGRVMTGSRPEAGCEVQLGLDRPIMSWGRVSMHTTTKADAEGKFRFEKVPPGPLEVHARSPRQWLNKTLFVLQPGATAHVNIGGAGAPVVGRIIPPDGPSEDWAVPGNPSASIMTDGPQVPYPGGMSYQQQVDWAEGWWHSGEGRKHRYDHVTRGVAVGKDGSFRAEDVVPGDYRLHVQWDDVQAGQSRVKAKASHKFRVPPGVERRGDAPLDIGLIRLDGKPAPRRLEVGEAAPPIGIRTLDGKPLALADYRGKYVLIDFWATWCGPCIAEFPSLKAATDRYGKDGRVAFLGLSLDKEAKTAVDFLKKRADHPDAVQGFLGEWSDAGVASSYGVESIPAIFLIGPDGKVVARDLRGEDVLARLAGLLGEPEIP